MNLFPFGDFTLNSGVKSKWKIECDALTDDDIQSLAAMIAQMVGPFSAVEGVPRGGLRLADALKPYTTSAQGICEFVPSPLLIVDDVLTTGGSMERLRSEQVIYWDDGIIGAVVFSRGQCPQWIKSVFQMPECFWLPGVVTKGASCTI